MIDTDNQYDVYILLTFDMFHIYFLNFIQGFHK